MPTILARIGYFMFCRNLKASTTDETDFLLTRCSWKMNETYQQSMKFLPKCFVAHENHNKFAYEFFMKNLFFRPVFNFHSKHTQKKCCKNQQKTFLMLGFAGKLYVNVFDRSNSTRAFVTKAYDGLSKTWFFTNQFSFDFTQQTRRISFNARAKPFSLLSR